MRRGEGSRQRPSEALATQLRFQEPKSEAIYPPNPHSLPPHHAQAPNEQQLETGGEGAVGKDSARHATPRRLAFYSHRPMSHRVKEEEEEEGGGDEEPVSRGGRLHLGAFR